MMDPTESFFLAYEAAAASAARTLTSLADGGHDSGDPRLALNALVDVLNALDEHVTELGERLDRLEGRGPEPDPDRDYDSFDLFEEREEVES